MREIVSGLLFLSTVAVGYAEEAHDILLMGVPISGTAECKEDYEAVKEVCNLEHNDMKAMDLWQQNVQVLECLQRPPDNTQLSENCDHYLWKLKTEVTNTGFMPDVKKFCKDSDTDAMRDMCRDVSASGAGHFLHCVVETRHKTGSMKCRRYLQFIEKLLFSDYRLVSNFMAACEGSIKRLGCGRATGVRENDPHSQGKTIACLEDKYEDVDNECKHSILEIAEIQGENVEFDHVLFNACSDDIIRFCSAVAETRNPSPGAIYDCLMDNKMKPDMTAECSAQISRRQRLISIDYKVSGGLVAACQNDIQENQCVKGDDKDGTGLSKIIICLDDAALKGVSISGGCMREMNEYRRALMSDFSITPELHSNCLNDIKQFCSNSGKNGKTIHCLMEVASEKDPDRSLTKACQNTLDEFVREVQSEEDWTADPVLEDACEDVVAAVCDPRTGKTGVMSCLMENVARDSKAMTGECRDVLMQIHYFLSREVTLDRELYRQCRSDARTLCDAKDGWHHKESDPLSKLVFPCLVRNLYNEDEDEDDEGDEDDNAGYSGKGSVSQKCSDEIERVLRQRAVSARLYPGVEQPCRAFLHSQCTSHTGPGDEMICLQQNLEILPVECKRSVEKYTAMSARNVYLHPNIMKGCQGDIQESCGMEHKAEDAQGVLECLTRLNIDRPQGSPDALDPRCAVVVQTWQLLTLKDFHFSHSFKMNCKKDIKTHCKEKKAKYEVVHCLAAIEVDDVVNDNPIRLHPGCREELRYELLQKRTSLKMNPLLERACKVDLANLCPGLDGPDAEECLKQQNHKELSPVCRRVLLGDEEEEAVDQTVDLILVRACKKEIRQFCPHTNETSVIECLGEFAEEVEFGDRCLGVLKTRINQQSHDYRLNVDLSRACHTDITKYCVKEIHNKAEFQEGKIIFCLTEKYSANVNLLTRKCSKEMQKFIRREQIGTADPILEEKCPNSVRKCAIGLNGKSAGPQGTKGVILVKELVVDHECLFKLWMEGGLLEGEQCAETLAIVAEAQNRDVRADKPLYDACQLDLARFCRGVASGEGKRFACLVGISKDENFMLEPDCDTIVKNRIAMYRVAVQAHPVAQAMELYATLMDSPERNVFLSLFASIVLLIFVFGLCFGRVTKRVNVDMKNR